MKTKVTSTRMAFTIGFGLLVLFLMPTSAQARFHVHFVYRCAVAKKLPVKTVRVIHPAPRFVKPVVLSKVVVKPAPKKVVVVTPKPARKVVVRPPAAKKVWIEGHWKHRPNGKRVWVKGHWKVIH